LEVVDGCLLELGEAVTVGDRVGRITGVVMVPEEQAGVAELAIGEYPQKQQQFPPLFATTNPGTTGCWTGSFAPAWHT